MIKASSQEKEPNIGVILHQIKIANIARIFGDFWKASFFYHNKPGKRDREKESEASFSKN